MNYKTYPIIPERLLVNKEAISRILGAPRSHIIQIKNSSRISKKVLLKDGKEVILTIEQLEAEFHRYRRDSGAKLEARPINENLWNVRGTTKNYRIEVIGNEYKCECKDHQEHGSYCKHIWAVILEQEARKGLTCEDCTYYTSHKYCKLRALADLPQLPSSHAVSCHFFNFEEF